jgi:MFS family permease
MTFAWILIDALGRRQLLLQGSIVLSSCFALLALFGGLTENSSQLHIPVMVPGIIGTVVLFIATGAFGIGWLSTVWLIPTEIFPTNCRAQGTAISVIIWGLANFAITFFTPVMFNNLSSWFSPLPTLLLEYGRISTYPRLAEGPSKRTRTSSRRQAKQEHGECKR